MAWIFSWQYRYSKTEEDDILPMIHRHAFVKWWNQFNAKHAGPQGVNEFFGNNPKLLRLADPVTFKFLNQKAKIAAFLSGCDSKDKMKKNLKEVLLLLNQDEAESSTKQKSDPNKDDDFYQNEDDYLTSWLKETDELINDTQMKKTCFYGWCPNCKWRYSRGKQLANKKELKSGNVGISPKLPGVEYHSSQDYVSFESRKSKIEELLDALENDSNFIIGLQGMGGTGKTTLAKEVGKKLKQLEQFDHVIDTTVSYTLDIRKTQDDIAAPLGLDFKDKNESERLKLLWSRLTGGAKILLILDDVWNPINFDEIGIPRKDNHKGCRIFLTTREMKVCQSMGWEKIIQLGFCSGEDAWTLFKKHAHISDCFSKRLLAKECEGLPVAIAAIASSLKGEQRLEKWKSTLKSLQKSVPMHGVDESLIEVYKCLRYTYDNLRNEEAKKLFLLCSLFPEDAEL
ncbi:disease resistance protein At4g27190-like [Abrus precatorius]|uniref:Disease resistance protein At4g27190-like n=1 Tax=Abrus precatorius TaxID=3816 RepID=A0A8B8K142_ABRPR|nr:disease resistance protein At4g27190-like [Abrus precatorius]